MLIFQTISVWKFSKFWGATAEEGNFQKAMKLLSFCSDIYLVVHTHIKYFSLNKMVGSIAKKKHVKWTEDELPLTRLSILVKNQNSDHKQISLWFADY